MQHIKSTNELYYDFIDSIELRTELTAEVINCKTARKQTQQQIADVTGIALTKIKQIENGSCKDFNAIYNYIGYMGGGILRF